MIEFHALISQLTGNDKEYFENWKEQVDLSSISGGGSGGCDGAWLVEVRVLVVGVVVVVALGGWG
jgi:hypothetical protein